MNGNYENLKSERNIGRKLNFEMRQTILHNIYGEGSLLKRQRHDVVDGKPRDLLISLCIICLPLGSI